MKKRKINEGWDIDMGSFRKMKLAEGQKWFDKLKYVCKMDRDKAYLSDMSQDDVLEYELRIYRDQDKSYYMRFNPNTGMITATKSPKLMKYHNWNHSENRQSFLPSEVSPDEFYEKFIEDVDYKHIPQPSFKKKLPSNQKPDYMDESVENWAKFGSWHNKYPKGTKFNYNGSRWVAENRLAHKIVAEELNFILNNSHKHMIREMEEMDDEDFDAEWQENFDKFMKFARQYGSSMGEYEELCDIADTRYYLFDCDEHEEKVKNALRDYLDY